MRYAVKFEQGKRGWGAAVPDLGVFAMAETLDQARALVAAAADFHIEGLRQRGEEVPQPTTVVEDVGVAT